MVHGLSPDERFAKGTELVEQSHVDFCWKTAATQVGKAGEVFQDAAILLDGLGATFLGLQIIQELANRRTN